VKKVFTIMKKDFMKKVFMNMKNRSGLQAKRDHRLPLPSVGMGRRGSLCRSRPTRTSTLAAHVGQA